MRKTQQGQHLPALQHEQFSDNRGFHEFMNAFEPWFKNNKNDSDKIKMAEAVADISRSWNLTNYEEAVLLLGSSYARDYDPHILKFLHSIDNETYATSKSLSIRHKELQKLK